MAQEINTAVPLTLEGEEGVWLPADMARELIIQAKIGMQTEDIIARCGLLKQKSDHLEDMLKHRSAVGDMYKDTANQCRDDLKNSCNTPWWKNTTFLGGTGYILGAASVVGLLMVLK